MTENTQSALDQLNDIPASDELVEAMADLMLRIEAGHLAQRHDVAWIEGVVPDLLVRIRELRSRVAELEAHPVDWDAQRRRADIAEEALAHKKKAFDETVESNRVLRIAVQEVGNELDQWHTTYGGSALRETLDKINRLKEENAALKTDLGIANTQVAEASKLIEGLYKRLNEALAKVEEEK